MPYTKKLKKESLTGYVYNREKVGSCSAPSCKSTKVLDCRKCGRHDLCFEHMGVWDLLEFFAQVV